MDSFDWFRVLILQAIFVAGTLVGMIITVNPDNLILWIMFYTFIMLITFLIMSFKLGTETKGD